MAWRGGGVRARGWGGAGASGAGTVGSPWPWSAWPVAGCPRGRGRLRSRCVACISSRWSRDAADERAHAEDCASVPQRAIEPTVPWCRGSSASMAAAVPGSDASSSLSHRSMLIPVGGRLALLPARARSLPAAGHASSSCSIKVRSTPCMASLCVVSSTRAVSARRHRINRLSSAACCSSLVSYMEVVPLGVPGVALGSEGRTRFPARAAAGGEPACFPRDAIFRFAFGLYNKTDAEPVINRILDI